MIALDWYQQGSTTSLTTIEQDWLFNDSSLTNRLISLSNQQFSIDVLNEHKDVLYLDEYQILQVTSKQLFWVREVILKGKGVPWIYARSISTNTSIDNDGDLIRLGSNSLGSLLFNNKAFIRSPIEITCFPKDRLPNLLQYDGLWARRSCFSDKRITVLVQEVFLPTFWNELLSQ